MSIEKIKQDFVSLITSLNSCSLFLLGSGVSIRYAKTIEQTKEKIKTEIIENGLYSASINNSPSELRELLLKHTPEFEELPNLDCWFYENSSTNEEFENLYLKNILPISTQFCPEYDVFNQCSLKSVILDFNHDSLSEIFIKNRKIKIFYPHGRFPFHAPDLLNSMTDIQWSYNLNLFDRWKIHPPLSEKKKILASPPYSYLVNNFCKFANINIIGYSFCDIGYALQDSYTFELITELAREHQKEINIINPKPYELKHRIASATNNKVNINCLELKWDFASRAILNSCLLLSSKNYYLDRNFLIDMIVKCYICIEENPNSIITY